MYVAKHKDGAPSGQVLARQPHLLHHIPAGIPPRLLRPGGINAWAFLASINATINIVLLTLISQTLFFIATCPQQYH
jgi:hypothetical protein